MRILLTLFICTCLLKALSLSRIASKDVVYDASNHLLWMDSMDNVNLKMSHKEAEPYCESLTFAGYSDWRLPHIDEYKLIVDKNNKRSNIHKTFRYNRRSGYWAQTAHFRTFWFYADYMNFISGTAYYDNRNVSKYVRCIRDTK